MFVTYSVTDGLGSKVKDKISLDPEMFKNTNHGGI